MYTVYSKPGCVNCDRAKALLKMRNIPYEERVIDVGQEKQDQTKYVTVEEVKTKFPGASSVPLFEHNGKPVGGYAEFLKHI